MMTALTVKILIYEEKSGLLIKKISLQILMQHFRNDLYSPATNTIYPYSLQF